MTMWLAGSGMALAGWAGMSLALHWALLTAPPTNNTTLLSNYSFNIVLRKAWRGAFVAFECNVVRVVIIWPNSG